MTVMLCLNFGDRIYLASDSLVTNERNGKLIPTGKHCLKLYTLRRYNAVVGFAGSIDSARHALAQIASHASSQGGLDEESLFDDLPGLLDEVCKTWDAGKEHDLDIMYAGLVANSRAYENEVFPGLGVPPKTACGYISLRGHRRAARFEKGSALLVPTHPKIKVTPVAPDKLLATDGQNIYTSSGFTIAKTDSNMLMDGFVIGSGAGRIAPTQRLYDHKYNPPSFVMPVLSAELQSCFDKLPIEETGVGGAFQVALITNEGTQIQVFDHRNPSGVSIQYKHGAFFVPDLETGKDEIVQTIWDPRWEFEFREYGYLL